jgi:hypothetical protein
MLQNISTSKRRRRASLSMASKAGRFSRPFAPLIPSSA